MVGISQIIGVLGQDLMVLLVWWLPDLCMYTAAAVVKGNRGVHEAQEVSLKFST